MSKLVGILLAAGKSSRFGSQKLLYPLSDNTPMILASAAKLVHVLPDSIVVINHTLSGLTRQLEKMGMRVVINEQAEKGMGCSIACGVRASDDASAWLIMLADMPYIKTETIGLLADTLKCGAKMVAPVLNQQRGHPVGFNQCFKHELLALNDDMGARQVLKKYQHALELVSITDEGVLIDVDQVSDVL
ncbi:MAG: nucleotidyltransferase family protein [Gammaproteobacteria bacterium]|nr:nucleotidyltransferase family protein [Gammaproteobacteria bacterium]MDH5735560.1 nucleotidyltransferase family protein [Gammaproteobacteria bacterium]